MWLPGQWNDRTCDLPLHYICIKKVLGVSTVPTEPSTSTATSEVTSDVPGFTKVSTTSSTSTSTSTVTVDESTPGTEHEICPDGWLPFYNETDRCYFLSNTNKSWPDALSDCQRQGADLLSIHNDEENTYVSTSITQERTWIGLNDRSHEGVFRWADGSPATFAHWNAGQPDNMNPDEDCVEINFGQPDQWNDNECIYPLHYICIKKVSATTTVSPTSSTPTATSKVTVDASTSGAEHVPGFSTVSTASSTSTATATATATATSTSTVAVDADPCTNYTTLLEGLRDINLGTNKSSAFLCDDELQPGWYRFSEGEVAISSVHKYHCGTKSTIWMNDKFPSVEDGIADKTFCFNHLDLTPNGCLWSEKVPVKNCRGEFMVYHLPLETILCPMAICTDASIKPCNEYEISASGFPPCTKIPCPPGKTSPSGFQPCRDMYPVITGRTLLTGPEQIDGTYQHTCTFDSADNSTDARFRVKWLMNNIVVETVTLHGGNRTSFFDVNMWTGHVNKNLECSVQSYFENTSFVRSTEFHSNEYFGGIKVEPSPLSFREGVDQTITVIATLPVVCDNATSDSCEVVLETVAPGLFIGGQCQLVLTPSSWDEDAHESRFNLSLGTQVDPAVKPAQTLSISFATMPNNVPGLEYWSSITMPPVKVLNTDTRFSTCVGSGDPHFTSSFNPGIFHELGVTYYNLYHLGDFNFASDTRAQLTVQARMSIYTGTGRAMICAVAVQKGDDVIFIDSCHRSVPSVRANNVITDGSVQVCGSNEYQITTNQGHRISVIAQYSWYTVTIAFPHGVVPLEAFDNKTTYQEVCNPSVRVNGEATFTTGGVIADSTVGYFRVQPDQNLFEGHRVKMVTPSKNSGFYCSCEKGRQSCGRGQKVIDPHVQRGSCRPIVPAQMKQGAMITQSPTVDPANYIPPVHHWPTPSGITEKEAKDRCRTAISKYTHHQCSSLKDLNMDAFVNSCAEDILASDGYAFISSAVHDFKSQCEISITSNINNYNTTANGTLQAPDILAETCPNLCSMHGTCVDGECHCESGTEWQDCSVKTGQPFNITGIEQGALCDKSKDTNCFNPRLLVDNLGDVSSCMVEQAGYLKGRPLEGFEKHPVQFVREHASIVASNLRPIIRNPEFEAMFFKIFLTESTTSKNQTSSISYTIYDGTCQMCENFICYEKLDACTINGRCYKDGHVDRVNGTHTYVCDPATSLDQWTTVPTVWRGHKKPMQ
ncbi:von Willebrand factor D and EGF domain-containing protein-like [Haliotis asinina]|uniref:von Willebrand factor D and EGF domain-containing protein-like n=1 Tax=Haliotis asinina TaxID=109174 RepID=UPI0035320328